MDSRCCVPPSNEAKDRGTSETPEEYDLDTYTLPVDAAEPSYVALSSTFRRNPGVRVTKPSGCNGTSAPLHGEGLNSQKFDSLSRAPFRSKRLLCSRTGDTSTPSGVPKCNGVLHDDPLVCSCCACNVISKKSRLRDHETRSGRAKAAIDDFVTRKGEGRDGCGRSPRNHPTFLKTVSIIDTLSELGPEVRHLASAPRPRKSTSSLKVHPSTTENAPDRACPPHITPDFQQYTEKIYDAVTSRSERSFPVRQTKTLKSKSSFSEAEIRIRRDFVKENGSSEHPPSGTCPVKRYRYRDRRRRERGRTPDWIKRLFYIAKKGDLEALKEGVIDMDETLVRNITDHAGNNLLHVMAVFGHLESIVWILSTHGIMVDALQDENKYGLTPLVCSIKYGRRRIVQWFIENTNVRDKVKCKDGERSLLHIAAKYAQEEIVLWLVKYMISNNISLDNKDHHGNTSLHLLARSGNSRVCSILLQNGADVTLKNDLDQKAWEICIARGHLACAEYLCVHETGLALATELTKREAELEATMTDNQDLRINFKEVLAISRQLLKEREEVVRDMSKIYEQMTESYDDITTLHILSEEGGPALSGLSASHPQREQIDMIISYLTNLQEKWQTVHKSWFGSSLVSMKHKMLLAEESWKKLKHRSHRTVASTHHPLDIFRSKLCEVRAKGGESRLGDLCTSEESLTSLPFSDTEEDGNYELPLSSTPGNVSFASDKKFTNKEAIYSYRVRGGSPMDISSECEGIESSPYWDEPGLCCNKLNSGDRNEDLSSHLNDLALTAESGSCSVLEVIEPSNEENEGERLIQTSSAGDLVEEEDQSVHRESRGKGSVCPHQEELPEASLKRDLFTEHDFGAQSQEMANSEGAPDGVHFLGHETSGGAAATDVSDNWQRLQDRVEGQEQMVIWKRKGFLYKLIKPQNWSSKRKVKAVRKMEADDFLESYSSQRELPSTNDAEIQINPESSSQEYPEESSSRPTDELQPILLRSKEGKEHDPRRSLSCRRLDNQTGSEATLILSEESTFDIRPESSLQKSNLSLNQDMIATTPDSSTAGRVSPAPSEISKTESALSPPSHASDLSKCESLRQTSLGKGGLCRGTSGTFTDSGNYSVTQLPATEEAELKPTDDKLEDQLEQGSAPNARFDLKEDTPEAKKGRPWYELSDEESDILLLDRATSIKLPRSSSSEDEAEVC